LSKESERVNQEILEGLIQQKQPAVELLTLRDLIPLNQIAQDTADWLSCKYLWFPCQLTETS